MYAFISETESGEFWFTRDMCVFPEQGQAICPFNFFFGNAKLLFLKRPTKEQKIWGERERKLLVI